MSIELNSALVTAVARLKKFQVLECFDPVNLDTRPTAKQLECLQDINRVSHRYVTAGNQAGKSQLGARECAWVFTETHPFWTRKPEWGTEPLLLLVVGRVGKQVEEVLWRKISAFLEPDSYVLQRIGGSVQKVTHRATGNTIVFGSHNSDREAREKLQAYVAHWCWVDELPQSTKLMEELHRRVQAKRGTFLATFTPKTPNAAIREMVDNSKAPLAKKYQFSMLDNPIYNEDDKKKIVQSLETLPEGYRNTILYGDWYGGDSSVYSFSDSMIEEPAGYHPSWRHAESSDPALSSKHGLTVWAENPATGVWYLIRADYVTGFTVPEELVEEVQKRTQGVNIVRRISDPHEVWYIGTATRKGMSYISPFDKNSRKGELIKGLQSALTSGIIKIAPWCTDFIKEVESCQWSDTVADKIVNASSYHLMDASQYFVDCRPRSGIQVSQFESWHHELRHNNDVRKKQEARAQKLSQGRRTKWALRRY